VNKKAAEHIVQPRLKLETKSYGSSWPIHDSPVFHLQFRGFHVSEHTFHGADVPPPKEAVRAKPRNDSRLNFRRKESERTAGEAAMQFPGKTSETESIHRHSA